MLDHLIRMRGQGSSPCHWTHCHIIESQLWRHKTFSWHFNLKLWFWSLSNNFLTILACNVIETKLLLASVNLASRAKLTKFVTLNGHTRNCSVVTVCCSQLHIWLQHVYTIRVCQVWHVISVPGGTRIRAASLRMGDVLETWRNKKQRFSLGRNVVIRRKKIISHKEITMHVCCILWFETGMCSKVLFIQNFTLHRTYWTGTSVLSWSIF